MFREFFAARFFLKLLEQNLGRQQRELPLESKLKRLGETNKLVKENAAASNEPINLRERVIVAISLNRACFTFSLDNNSDILMLIEITFD